MDGEKLCPLVRRPCDSACAWYVDDSGECSIHLLAHSLDMINQNFMNERTNYE